MRDNFILIIISRVKSHTRASLMSSIIYITFFNLPRPATATTATASRLRSQKLHIVLWGLPVGLVL